MSLLTGFSSFYYVFYKDAAPNGAPHHLSLLDRFQSGE
jgi:hypothetical protein